MRKVLAGTAVLMALTGCASDAPVEETAVEEVPQPAEKSVLEPWGTPEEIYCDAFTDSMTEYADAVAEVMSDGVYDSSKWMTLSINLSKLDPSELGNEWMQDHDDYMSIFNQVQDGAASGAERVTLNSEAYKNGVLALVQDCLDAGYSKAESE